MVPVVHLEDLILIFDIQVEGSMKAQLVREIRRLFFYSLLHLWECIVIQEKITQIHSIVCGCLRAIQL